MKQTWQTFNPGLLTPHRHRPFRAHPGHHPLAIEMEGLGKKSYPRSPQNAVRSARHPMADGCPLLPHPSRCKSFPQRREGTLGALLAVEAAPLVIMVPPSILVGPLLS